MKKPNSSLNIFVACAVFSLIAGVVYARWIEESKRVGEAVSRFYGTSHKAGDVYVDWKLGKDGKFESW